MKTKRLFKIAAAALCCALITGLLPANAQESAFLSITVETIDSSSKVQTAEEVCYTDGQYLYVTPDFLSDYTLSYYDAETASFIRAGQASGSRYGSVLLDSTGKTATLYLNPFASQTYALHNVFEFGGQYFLPLDQMAGLLKARVFVDGTTITIANSGYSLSDAEYAFSTIENDKNYTYYNYISVVDDLYGGSEAAFFVSARKNYLFSAIFGKKLLNLDVRFQTGKIEEYESFLEKCVTDNSTYLEAVGSDNLQQRFADAQSLNRDIQTHADKFNEITTLVNKAAEPAKDSGLDTALLYMDTRDWGAALSTISTVSGYLDYLLSLGAMSEDHRNMLRAFQPEELEKNNAPLEIAVRKLKGRYTNDITLNLVNKAGQLFVEELANRAGDAIVDAVIPSSAVISGAAAVLKAMGFDPTSNQEYSILIDINAQHVLRNACFLLPDNHYQSEEQTEEYRLAVLFFLLSCRETFRAANQVAASTGVPGDYYDDRIETIESVLNLFYAAARSRQFDSFSGVDDTIGQSRSAIDESGIIHAAGTLTEEEAIALLQKPDPAIPAAPASPPLSVLEEDASVMANFILNHYKEYMNWNTGNEILLIDLTNSGLPELVFASFSPSGGNFIDHIVSFYNNAGCSISEELFPIAASPIPALNQDGQLCFTTWEIPGPDEHESVKENFFSKYGSVMEYTFGPKEASDQEGVHIPIYSKKVEWDTPEQAEKLYTYFPDKPLILYTQAHGPDGTLRNKPLAEENDTFEELYRLILNYLTAGQNQ